MIKKCNTTRKIRNILILIALSISVICVAILLLHIEKDQNKELLYRSSSLNKCTVDEETVSYIEYFDYNGSIAYAANLHYAKLVRTKIGSNIIEEYFDEKGNRSIQAGGYYAIIKNYDKDGDWNRLVYLDENMQSISCINGYSEVVRDIQDKEGSCQETYYINGENVRSILGVEGCRYLYDDFGRIITTIYTNKDGEPENTYLGYSIIKRKFYESGEDKDRIESQFYYDKDGVPIALANGEYGIHQEYDLFGRSNRITYLDCTGNPIITNKGYTTILRTFYNDDSIESEMYYDIDGNTFDLGYGRYGIIYTNDGLQYLDENGNRIFDLSNLVQNYHFLTILTGIVLVGTCMLVGKRTNTIILVSYLLFVLYITIFSRNTTFVGSNTELFWSYRQFFSDESLRREILNNIWLFIPIGVMLARICHDYKSLVGLVLLSICIEIMQLFLRVGLCELDDIVSNTVGGIIGYFFALEIRVNFDSRYC